MLLNGTMNIMYEGHIPVGGIQCINGIIIGNYTTAYVEDNQLKVTMTQLIIYASKRDHESTV